MRSPVRKLVLGFVFLGLSGLAQPADAQVGDRLKQRAKNRIEQKAGEKVDRAVDRAVDGADQTATGAQPSSAAETAAPASPASAPAAANARPGEGAWANYDFVPGERIIFADDFTRDNVGNFPQRFEFQSGNMEIVEWQGRRWLRAEGGEFLINLPETLPERFTMEFDLAGSGNGMEISFVNDQRGYDRRLEIGTWFARLRSGSVDGQGELGVKTDETPVRIRISVDGGYLKLYANEKRALNVPNANVGRSNRIFVFMNGWRSDQPRLIGDLRIAAGGKKLYDALAAEGRVATQGIMFDTGSDRIRPESTPTLKEIGDMLRQHGDLRIRIEGHTDNVGNAASNQALSQTRAESVKQYLVSSYGIDAGRLETQGFGASKPSSSNDSPEGRQQNRRVELVRL
ncbi:hypothetical protein BH24GEM3_BH24GEM3_11520 [soil metagenome]